MSMGIEIASWARKRTALASCLSSSTPAISKARTPMRFVATPSRTWRRGSECLVKNSSSAAPSPMTSRTSPPVTIPEASGSRATWRSFAAPLLTTRAAASCDPPILSPTTSRLFGRPRLRPPFLEPVFGNSRVPGSLVFGCLLMRSPSLISFFRFMLLDLRCQPQPTSGRHRRFEFAEAGPLEQTAKLVGAARPRKAHLRGDHAPEHEVGERLLHRLHPARRARLHDRVDLLDLRLPDEVPHRVVRHQDLERRHAAAAVGGRDQVLRHDTLERRGELHADLVLLGGRERIDDAVDRGGRALRVQCREHQMARLRGGERRRDRLEVTHLADEDDVGVLAE